MRTNMEQIVRDLWSYRRPVTLAEAQAIDTLHLSRGIKYSTQSVIAAFDEVVSGTR